MIDIELLRMLSNVTHFKAMHEVITEGDSVSKEMYILLKGKASVYKNYGKSDEVKLATLEEGAFFGEMSLFLDKERTATVVTDTECIALELDNVEAIEFFEKQPGATHMIISTLCKRLDHLNVAYNKLAAKVATMETDPTTAETLEEIESLISIYPSGHKKYNLSITPTMPNLIVEKTFTCPLCNTVFSAPEVKNLSLNLISTDRDFRPRHKGIEVYYYDIITCPHCYYSALRKLFKDGIGRYKDNVYAKIEQYTQEIEAVINNKEDISSVFVSYYLAQVFASFCFYRNNVIDSLAKIWLRISWLYSDCGDASMEVYAIRQAQIAYISLHDKTELLPSQRQQACMIISELSYKLKDMKNAKYYMQLARICEDGNPVMNRQAAERLREMSRMKE